MTASRTVSWYWHRLRVMDASEVAIRVLRHARSWGDRLPRRSLPALRLDAVEDACPMLPDPRAAPAALREAVSSAATAVRAGRWVLFGWKAARLPLPPPWQCDFTNGSSAPAGPELRNVWETNRWAELVTLAQHAWLNGAPQDARLAQTWLLDWCEQNPPGAGAPWHSAMEAAIRLVNFCWIDALVRDGGDPDLCRVQDALARLIVPAHARWVWRHRSPGSSANNHLIAELAGLVLAARRWPAVARLACSAERAWELLAKEILRQFAADGGNREQALHYHQFAWELAWQAHRVMGAADEAVADRLRAAAQCFCDLAHVYDPWDFGDSDDAQVTPLTATRATAAPEWKAWLLEREPGAALGFWLGAPPSGVAPLPRGRWRAYPQTGIAAQEVNGWKARVDGSPLGFGRTAVHGHLDALHLSLWDGPHALVIDPGTGAYQGDPALRAGLASWELHNGPIPVSGRSRPQRRGAFIWSDHHPRPQLTLDGQTCLVRWRGDGPAVQRSVEYVPGLDGWRVTDEIAGSEPHVVRWRLAPDWRVESREGREVQFALVHATGRVARLTVETDDLIDCVAGEDVVSPHFGELRRGAVIALTFTGRLLSQWHRAGPEQIA
jgi:hypothetical protein